MDRTFINPYLAKMCNTCQFVAKTPGGLQVHIRAKHKVSDDSNSPEIVISEDNIVENSFQCDKCEFLAPSEENLNDHKHLKHEHDTEEIEIKLDVFALVDFENDVLQARKSVIEKLEES